MSFTPGNKRYARQSPDKYILMSNDSLKANIRIVYVMEMTECLKILDKVILHTIVSKACDISFSNNTKRPTLVDLGVVFLNYTDVDLEVSQWLIRDHLLCITKQ